MRTDVSIVDLPVPTVSDDSPLGWTEPSVTDGSRLRWSRFLESTEAEGPGARSALWVQGCSVRCPGCFNPHLWAARGAMLDDTAALTDRFVSASVSAGVEGVTLLGGEPFDQAAALAAVAEGFREAGLTVMTFTGYRLGSLREWSRRRSDMGRLLEATDLLVDGPYLADRPDTRRPWLGSANQGLTALSPAYAKEVARIHGSGGVDRLEVRIARDGTVMVNGWADDEGLAALLDDLGARADRPARMGGTS